jgi:hypothetical protein
MHARMQAGLEQPEISRVSLGSSIIRCHPRATAVPYRYVVVWVMLTRGTGSADENRPDHLRRLFPLPNGSAVRQEVKLLQRMQNRSPKP